MEADTEAWVMMGGTVRGSALSSAEESLFRTIVAVEKAAAGFGVTHGLHRQSPPAHPHTGMKGATIGANPCVRESFNRGERTNG